MILGVLITVLVAAAILAPFVLLGGWVTMLCFGALAHIFGAAALSIGFWPAVLVSLILTLLLGH